MDAVDPHIIEHIEHHTQEVDGVQHVTNLRARWIGHRLFVEMTIEIDSNLTFIESHQLSEAVRNNLLGSIHHLSEVTIRTVPHVT